MGSKAAQADAVARLVHESVASVDALTPEAMRAVLPALRAARDELRTDLRDWLQAAPGNGDRFTAHDNRVALRYLEGALERVKELQPAMAKGLADGRRATGPVAVKNLETEISRLSSVFEGTPSMPRIDIAAVMARSESALWRRHAASAKRYAGGVGEDIQHQFEIGVAKGESMEQLITRLRRLGDPGAKKRGIDPGDDAAGIADGLFRRHKWWAERLVRTEMMYAYNTQHDEATREADEQIPAGEERYLRKWDATADNRLCPLCRELDGTVATIDGAFAGGIQRPPRHACCRCLALAWMASWGGINGPLPKGWGEEKKRKAKPAPRKAARPTPMPAVAAVPPNQDEPPKLDRPQKTPVKPAKQLVKPAATARTVGQLDPAAADVMERLSRGDLNGATVALDRMLGDSGLIRRSIPNNGQAVVNDDHMAGARAHRYWNSGLIELSSGVADEIKKYSQEVGTALPSHMTAELEKEAAAIYKQRLRISNSSMSAKKKEKALSGLDNTAIRNKIAAIELNQDGVKTLIHEVIHGFSPLAPASYAGHGTQIEEITTEVMARVISRDRFGMKMTPHHRGSYAYDIEGATNAIAAISGESPEAAYGRLQRVAAEFKKQGKRDLADTNDVVDSFTKHIINDLGIRDEFGAYGKVRNQLEQHLNAAAKKWAEVQS